MTHLTKTDSHKSTLRMHPFFLGKKEKEKKIRFVFVNKKKNLI